MSKFINTDNYDYSMQIFTYASLQIITNLKHKTNSRAPHGWALNSVSKISGKHERDDRKSAKYFVLKVKQSDKSGQMFRGEVKA